MELALIKSIKDIPTEEDIFPEPLRVLDVEVFWH